MSGPVTLAPVQATSASARRVTLAPLRQAWSRFWLQDWSRLWFQDKSTSPLEIARIGIGAALLLHYGLASPYLFTLWGDDGWVPRALLADDIGDPWKQSVFFYFTAPWQWVAFHALFLFCCAALMVGWRTSWVKWVVLVGNISYDYRNPSIAYGVHAILCLPAVDPVLRADRTRDQPGQSARGLVGQTQEPRSRSAGLHQSMGVRLHEADANPDGRAVLLQRHRQAQRRRLVERRRHLEGLRQRRLLQWLSSRPARVAVLAGQCCELWDHSDRDRLPVPDLATALAALPAGRSHIPPPSVRAADEPVFLLLRHDHGAHELRAPRVAERARRLVEAKDRRHGDDLRRHTAASANARWHGSWRSTVSGRSGYATFAPILRRS